MAACDNFVLFISITSYSFKRGTILSGYNRLYLRDAKEWPECAMLVTDHNTALQGLHTAFLPVLSMRKPFC